MSRIPEHVVQQIRDRVSIVDVVGDYVTLKKDGANHKGLCPFHSEKTPSFKVHEDKGIYKCFGCGESGNVFGFLMKLENMSFVEVAERLAARAGIDIPKEPEKPEEKKRRMKSERLFEANRAAAEFYHENLMKSPEAEPAREYLKNRGVDGETARRYLLGYSPDDWRKTLARLESRGFDTAEIKESGLALESDKGGHYDRFRGRLMFPIVDIQNRVRGFGARLIKDEPNQPKYLNTPETPIFKKGQGFFGINLAKDGIRKTGRVVVVEGYTDQMALDRAGINYGVATLGTALTQDHARLLRRYRPEVFVVFDADEAGQKAGFRALEVLLEEDLSPRVVAIPDGKDPDDFLSRHGAEDFEKLLDAAPTLLGHFMDRELAGAGDTPAALAKAVGRSVEMISRIGDPIERSVFVDRLARKSGVPMHEIEVKLRRPSKKAGAAGSESGSYRDDAFPVAELDLLRFLIHHPEMAERVRDSGVIDGVTTASVVGFLRDMIDGPGASPQERLHLLEDENLKDRVTSMLMEKDPFAGPGVADRAIEDIIFCILQGGIRKRLLSLYREIGEAQEKGDEGRWRRLIEEQSRLLDEQRRMSADRPGR